MLTLLHYKCRLLMSFENSLDQDQVRQNGLDLDLNCFTFWWYSWIYFYHKIISSRQKTRKISQYRQRASVVQYSLYCQFGAEIWSIQNTFFDFDNKLWRFRTLIFCGPTPPDGYIGKLNSADPGETSHNAEFHRGCTVCQGRIDLQRKKCIEDLTCTWVLMFCWIL